MTAYINLIYLRLALRHRASVLSSPSPLVGGWLGAKYPPTWVMVSNPAPAGLFKQWKSK